MPKQLVELKNFLKGITSSPDPKDIHSDGATYSENIDATTVEGRLQGIDSNKILTSDGFASEGPSASRFSFNIKTPLNSQDTYGLFPNPTWADTQALAYITEINSSTSNFVLSNWLETTTVEIIWIVGLAVEEAVLTSLVGKYMYFYDSSNYVQRVKILSVTPNASGTTTLTCNPSELRLIADTLYVDPTAGGFSGTAVHFGHAGDVVPFPSQYVQWTVFDQDYYIWYADSSTAIPSYHGIDPNPMSLIESANTPIGIKVPIDMRTGSFTSSGVNTAILNALGSTYDSVFTNTESGGDIKILATANGEGNSMSRSWNPLTLVNPGIGRLSYVSNMITMEDFIESYKTNVIFHDKSNSRIGIITDIYSNNPAYTTLTNDFISSQNISMTNVRNSVFLGTGAGGSYIPQVIRRTNHKRLGNSIDRIGATDSRNLPLDRLYSYAGFDDVMIFPIYGIKQQLNSTIYADYDVELEVDPSAKSLYEHINDGSGLNLNGLAIGGIFKTQGATDFSDGAMAIYKNYAFNDEADVDPVDGDLFMYVGNGTSGAYNYPILQYVGNVGAAEDEATPSFAYAMSSASNSIKRISLTNESDDTSFEATGAVGAVASSGDSSGATGSVNVNFKAARVTTLNLSSKFSGTNESITTIAPCTSQPVHNTIGLAGAPGTVHTDGTTASSLYSDDGQIKYVYRHGVFWIATIDTFGTYRLYRANIIDFDELTADNIIKLEEIKLDFRYIPETLEAQIGNLDDYTYDTISGNSTGNLEGFAPGGHGGIVPAIPGDNGGVSTDQNGVDANPNPDGGTRPKDYQNEWCRDPAAYSAEIVGIIETNECGVLNSVTALEGVTDDTELFHAGGTGATITDHAYEFEAAGFKGGSQIRLTTGDKIRFAPMATTAASNKTFNKSSPYTVWMTDNDKFVVKSSLSGNSVPVLGTGAKWWNTKTWVMFRMPTEVKEDGFTQWDLFLFNFNPLTIDNTQKVDIADRTPPYSQAGYIRTRLSGGSSNVSHKCHYPRSFMSYWKYSDDNPDLAAWMSAGDTIGEFANYFLFNAGTTNDRSALEGSGYFARMQFLNKAGGTRVNGNGSRNPSIPVWNESGDYEEKWAGIFSPGENIGWDMDKDNWRRINPVRYTLHPSNIFASLHWGQALITDADKNADLGHSVHFIGKTHGTFIRRPRSMGKLLIHGEGINGWGNVYSLAQAELRPWVSIECAKDFVQADENLSSHPDLVTLDKFIGHTWIPDNVGAANEDGKVPSSIVNGYDELNFTGEYTYYTVDEWTGHPGIINKIITESDPNYGIRRNRPNFGGPEIETPRIRTGASTIYTPNYTDGDLVHTKNIEGYEDSTSAYKANNTWGGWNGYTPSSWGNPGHGYYIFINRTFASPSYGRKYNMSLALYSEGGWDGNPNSSLGKKHRFRWFNYGTTACRDSSIGVDYGATTGVPNSDTPSGSDSLSRFVGTDAKDSSVDIYDNGFTRLGDVITFRKIFNQSDEGYHRDFINGFKLFAHNDDGTPKMKGILVASDQISDDLTAAKELNVSLVAAGHNVTDNIDRNDGLIGDGWNNEGTGYSHWDIDHPIWNAHPAAPFEDSGSAIQTKHHHSTTLMETMGLSDTTSSIFVSGSTLVDDMANNSVDWFFDGDKFSNDIIAGDMSAFVLKSHDLKTSDDDKVLGFGVSDVTQKKYYIGGWRASHEWKFKGSDETLTDHQPSTGNDYIDVAMNMDTDGSTYTNMISVTDGSTGTTFESGQKLFYRLSLTYDGANESPLSAFTIEHPVGSNGESTEVKVNLPSGFDSILNERVTGVILWRKTGLTGDYTIVEELPLDSLNWVYDTSKQAYTITVNDYGEEGMSYFALTGISEDSTNTYVHYGLSVAIEGRLWVGRCWHPEMDDAITHVFRSEIDNYNTFDWANNNADLGEEPIAMMAYQGRVLIWTTTKMHLLETSTMSIVDTTEGISVFGPNAAISTDYGLFFADKNNIYLWDGSTMSPIGGPILHNTDNPSYGYQQMVNSSSSNGVLPSVFYDGPNTSVCIGLADSNGDGKIFSFNLISKRWDLYDSPKPLAIASSGTGRNLIADGLFVYDYRADISTKYSDYNRKAWRWDSKNFTMGLDTQEKVFRSINLTGTPTFETMTGSTSDSVRVYVDGVQKTLTEQKTKFASIINIGFKVGSIGANTILGYGGDQIGWAADNITPIFATMNLLFESNEFIQVGFYLQLTTGGEILKVSSAIDFIGPNVTLWEVERAQLGTTAEDTPANSWTDGSEVNIIAPRLKLPSGTKGKSIKIVLDEQKGYVDSLGIIYKPKGIK